MLLISGVLGKEVFLIVIMLYHHTAATDMVFVWDPQNLPARPGTNGQSADENKDDINNSKVKQDEYSTLPHATSSLTTPKDPNPNLQNTENKTQAENATVRISTEVGMDLQEITPNIPTDGVSGPDIPHHVQNVLRKLFGLAGAFDDPKKNGSFLTDRDHSSNTTPLPPVFVTIDDVKKGRPEVPAVETPIQKQTPTPEGGNEQKTTKPPTYIIDMTTFTKPNMNDLKGSDQTYSEQESPTLEVKPISPLTTTECPPVKNQNNQRYPSIPVYPTYVHQTVPVPYTIPQTITQAIPRPQIVYSPAPPRYDYGVYPNVPMPSYRYTDQVYGFAHRVYPSIVQYPVPYYVRPPLFSFDNYSYRSLWAPRSLFWIKNMKELLDSFN